MSEKNYYIHVNGSKIAVSKELYDYDRQSERKITYAEVDRKTERFKVDRENLKAEFIPSLEDSLDRLSEIGEQFSEKIPISAIALKCGLTLDAPFPSYRRMSVI